MGGWMNGWMVGWLDGWVIEPPTLPSLDYCSSIFAGLQGFGQRLDLLPGSGSFTTYPTICKMCCTGFHSHIASLTGSRHWCGGACLVGRPPICAISASLSPHVQAVVHPGPLPTVIWWSHSPALRQCRPVHFLWLVLQPGMDFQ